MDMKLNAILKEEAKSKITEVRRPTFLGTKPTGTQTDLYIGKTQVTVRQGVVQSELQVDGPISKEIEDLIVGVRVEVILNESVLGIVRARGKYNLPGDALTTGTVELYITGIVDIRCYGPTRENALALYELIRSGKICPSDAWDKSQIIGGPDHLKQLEDELKETKARLEGAMLHITGLNAEADLSEKTLRQFQQDFDEKNIRLRQLARALENTSLLPWVSRTGVAAQIDAILDDIK
jgi:hypothetical protein